MSVWESREARLESFKELKDGWFGPNSLAPKHFVIDAIAEALTQLDFGVIGHWAFGPFDGGVAFEHWDTYEDSDLKAVVTRDTDVWVIPTDDETFEIVVMVNESYFDDSVYDHNTHSTTKSSPYRTLREVELTVEGTVDNLVSALRRELL